MTEKDSTVTHFIANKKRDEKGFAIILYRFRKNSSGTERPQYLGPMGWSFHMSIKDKDIIPKLQPIEKFEEITGDNLEKEIWQEGNIYAG